MDDRYFPFEFDIHGAAEPVPVHLAVLARTRTRRNGRSFQKVLLMVCTRFNCVIAAGLLLHCSSVDGGAGQVFLLQL